ncbi:GNAT family N-acetyltransferase [Brevibacillus laterosporus]|uniref:GNAT family N-acetyltransferase n=1 Tax=Brevibacillus laterosporus TaxID=1465 RepID=UPI0035A61FF9
MMLREALVSEAEELSQLALDSKATWDYDEAFILACKEDLTINQAYIEKNHVYVLEKEGRVIGFFSFVRKELDSLDFLYMHRDYKGQGYGSILWSFVKEKAIELGIDKFTIDSDPHAKGFYLKMGARQIGEIPSTVWKDRVLPLLQFELKAFE